jgi:hypothetical protein
MPKRARAEQRERQPKKLPDPRPDLHEEIIGS